MVEMPFDWTFNRLQLDSSRHERLAVSFTGCSQWHLSSRKKADRNRRLNV